MSFAKFRFLALAVLWFLIVGLFVLNVFSMICPPGLVAYEEGTPVVTVRENDFLCTGIFQVVSDDENLYVLFGEYGVVQVYTPDGAYRYTISVYNHANGRTEIAVLKNRLYIEDKKSNLYVFENGSLIQYLDRSESYETRRFLSLGAWDADYMVKAGSVWYAPDGVDPIVWCSVLGGWGCIRMAGSRCCCSCSWHCPADCCCCQNGKSPYDSV